MDHHYELTTLENNEFKPFRDLREDEFLELKNHIDAINEYSKQFLSYIFFQLNLIELDKRIKSLSDISVTKFNVKAINNKQLFLEINRTVLNMLFSFKYYIDSSESYLKRKYGKKSIEASDFVSKTNEAFDNHFAYRFLTKLRDYAQHVGFPIHIVPFSAAENIKGPQSMKGSFQLVVSHELLLKEKIGAIVSADLKRIGMDIDIIPLIYKLGEIIADFESYILKLQRGIIENSIRLIEKYGENRKTNTNAIVIMFNVEIEKPYYTFDTVTLPFDEIKEIKNFINWKK